MIKEISESFDAFPRTVLQLEFSETAFQLAVLAWVARPPAIKVSPPHVLAESQ
jgi:hypothetical protein